MGKKHFCFFQTAGTGNLTPNSGVKGSGANHYPRAPRPVCLVEHKQNMSTGHLLDEGRDQPHEQVIEQIGCIYYRSRISKRVLTKMKYILLQIPHVSVPAVKIRKSIQLVYSIGLFLKNELAMRRH